MTITSLKTGAVYDSTLLAGNPSFVPTAFESIASATGTGSSGTITFSSIPSTYASLQIRFNAKDQNGGETILLRFNGDTASNYSTHRLDGNGSTASAGGFLGSFIYAYGVQVGTNATYMANGIIDIHNYANTSQYKTVRTFSGMDANGSGEMDLLSGNWRNTVAVTSLTLSIGAGSYFSTNSTFALYGIKG